MIVVTTPTGSIGRQLLDILVDRGAPVRVIARDPGRLPAPIAARVEVIQGSHGDRAAVNTAFAGAEAVFWLPPPNPGAASLDEVFAGFTAPACAAIVRHGVKRVVSVSALGRGLEVAENAGLVTASLAMDDALAATGAAFRALVMPSFMDNLLRQVAGIRDHGVFVMPLSGERKAPTCATRDIAAAAARLLLDPTWSGQGSQAVLGPEDLSFEDMAAIMTEVLGKPVRFQSVPGEAYKARLLGFGMSEAMAEGMRAMMAAKDAGLDNAEPRTAESTSPTSFRQWCAEVLKPAVVG